MTPVTISAVPGTGGAPSVTDRGWLLAAPTADIREHLQRHGAFPAARRAGALIREIDAAGLTGRGGAAFPTARKLQAVRAAGFGRAVIAGNGAEGEPASHKDVTLLWRAPHLVLDGLHLAAEACGATDAVLYVHGGQPALLRHLDMALRARHAAGADRLPVTLIAAPPRFLSGEESALVARAGGGAALPTFKQRLVAERGIAGRPTLVQNVETLAHIALIARHGAAWFRQAGTADEPGSMLCTLHQPDGRRDVVQLALGTQLGNVLELGDHVQAVLAGGYHGGWLTRAHASGLRMCNASLRPAGAFTGAGVLAAVPAGVCGLAEAARVTRYLALESAGQCGPCLNGLPRIAAALGAVARPRPARAELASLNRWAELVAGRGACHHPDGTTRFVTSALRVFAAEIAAHDRGRCTATTAAAFLPVPAVPLTTPQAGG
jgi:NADH:ubiquinone oxidoreductase subunit F (NADH-binding)